MPYIGQTVVENAGLFWGGYLVTILLSISAFVGALVLGTLAAALRVWGAGPLRGLATVYVEFFRNTPLLVQLFFYGTFLAQLGVTRSPIVAAIVGLSIYTGAFVTEAVRSGILSVDPRQMEAARSLGLSQLQALRHVVLPQAFRTVVPPLGNVAIALVKNTSLAGAALAANDLLQIGKILVSRTFQLEPFLGVIVGYLSLTVALAIVLGRLERRLAFSR